MDSISIKIPIHMLAPECINASMGFVISASMSSIPDVALRREGGSAVAASVPIVSRLVLLDIGVWLPEKVSFGLFESASEPVALDETVAARLDDASRASRRFLKYSFSFAMIPSRMRYARRSLRKLRMPSMMLSCRTPITADMSCV